MKGRKEKGQIEDIEETRSEEKRTREKEKEKEKERREKREEREKKFKTADPRGNQGSV